MDNANIVKLAKILGNFTELDSSFILTSDIKAITVHKTKAGSDSKGMDIVTPYGTFTDSMDFETFKRQVGIVVEALKEQKPEPKVEMKVVPLDPSPFPNIPNIKDDKPIQPKPVMNKEMTVTLSSDGAKGRFFDGTDYKIINREQLEILSPDGNVVAKGTSGGSVVGEEISGIVYENGKYTFAPKNYGSNSIKVRFQMQQR